MFFIPLATGYGKSICFALLPFVFDRMGGDVGSIVCVFRRRRPTRVTLQGSYAPIMLEGTKHILLNCDYSEEALYSFPVNGLRCF